MSTKINAFKCKSSDIFKVSSKLKNFILNDEHTKIAIAAQLKDNNFFTYDNKNDYYVQFFPISSKIYFGRIIAMSTVCQLDINNNILTLCDIKPYFFDDRVTNLSKKKYETSNIISNCLKTHNYILIPIFSNKIFLDYQKK
jgi:hypothetical protein